MQRRLRVDFAEMPGRVMCCSDSLGDPAVSSASFTALFAGASLRPLDALEVYNVHHTAQDVLMARLACRLRPTLTHLRLEFGDTCWSVGGPARAPQES